MHARRVRVLGACSIKYGENEAQGEEGGSAMEKLLGD